MKAREREKNRWFRRNEWFITSVKWEKERLSILAIFFFKYSSRIDCTWRILNPTLLLIIPTRLIVHSRRARSVICTCHRIRSPSIVVDGNSMFRLKNSNECVPMNDVSVALWCRNLKTFPCPNPIIPVLVHHRCQSIILFNAVRLIRTIIDTASCALRISQRMYPRRLTIGPSPFDLHVRSLDILWIAMRCQRSPQPYRSDYRPRLFVRTLQTRFSNFVERRNQRQPRTAVMSRMIIRWSVLSQRNSCKKHPFYHHSHPSNRVDKFPCQPMSTIDRRIRHSLHQLRWN